jgi:hypothetical protein
MSAFRVQFLALLIVLLALLLAGCPSDDDDSGVVDDDDSAADDDDAMDDDDAVDDDDGADDDDAAVDYVDAVVPTFDDCTGTQFKMMLGDGTELGPFDGFFPAPTSFANNFPQFTIRSGVDTAWTALNGNYEGMATGGVIPFEGPSSQAGNVVLQAMVDATAIGAAPADLAGNFGEPANNLHPDVGGQVVFSALPAPNAVTTGEYEGIIQKIVSFSDQQVLLGVKGCFSETLVPTDG